MPVAIFITSVCWAMVCFLIPDPPGEDVAYAFWRLLDIDSIPFWINKSVCLFIYFIIGYLLIQMNNTFGLIRVRASTQTSIFLSLIAACSPIQRLTPGTITALLFVVALYLLLIAYQHFRSSGYLFHTFLFVGLASLIFPQVTLLAPILLVGAFNFQALNRRSLLAALIGWGFPYWFLFGHAFFYDNMDLFYQPFIELTTFYPIDFSAFSLWELAVLGYTLVLFIVSSIHCLLQSYKDKIRTRIHLRFFILLNACIYLLIALQPNLCADLLPLSFVGISILTGHMFVLTSSKLSNVFFICSVIGLVLLFFFNLWTLL